MHVTILDLGVILVMLDWWSHLAMLGDSMEVLCCSTQNIPPSIHGIKGKSALAGLFIGIFFFSCRKRTLSLTVPSIYRFSVLFVLILPCSSFLTPSSCWEMFVYISRTMLIIEIEELLFYSPLKFALTISDLSSTVLLCGLWE